MSHDLRVGICGFERGKSVRDGESSVTSCGSCQWIAAFLTVEGNGPYLSIVRKHIFVHLATKYWTYVCHLSCGMNTDEALL